MSKKIYATLLLDQDNRYVYNNGDLPYRPMWDKHLLQSIANDEFVSQEGFMMLPPSIRKVVHVVMDKIYQPTLPITIPEIDELSDMLIISRSSGSGLGKIFRLDKFEQILCAQGIEIWRRKDPKTPKPKDKND